MIESTMAEQVEVDPESFRKGTRSVGDAYEGAQASGSRIAAILSGLAAAAGKDKPDNMVPFAENIATASGVVLPDALSDVHDAMRAGVEALEATEDSSAHRFG